MKIIRDEWCMVMITQQTLFIYMTASMDMVLSYDLKLTTQSL